jgi:hypothetical protein
MLSTPLNLPEKTTMTFPLFLPTALALILLAGCTTYTHPDGSRETLWGIPAEDESKSREEREAEGPKYRVPGEIPE